MPRRSVRLTVPSDELRSVFTEIRAELQIPEAFPPEVLEEAAASAADPRLPDADLTDVPFVTIDPPGSMDLDQALHLDSRPDGGFQLRYAIADVAAFVRPGGTVDAEAHGRVETAYSPTRCSPRRSLGRPAGALPPPSPTITMSAANSSMRPSRCPSPTMSHESHRPSRS